MKPRIKFRNTAARMISMIIAVVRMVPSNASRNMRRVKERVQAARPSANTTPSEAASVGVATPA
jgi:hypothetical protein